MFKTRDLTPSRIAIVAGAMSIGLVFLSGMAIEQSNDYVRGEAAREPARVETIERARQSVSKAERDLEEIKQRIDVVVGAIDRNRNNASDRGNSGQVAERAALMNTVNHYSERYEELKKEQDVLLSRLRNEESNLLVEISRVGQSFWIKWKNINIQWTIPISFMVISFCSGVLGGGIRNLVQGEQYDKFSLLGGAVALGTTFILKSEYIAGTESYATAATMLSVIGMSFVAGLAGLEIFSAIIKRASGAHQS